MMLSMVFRLYMEFRKGSKAFCELVAILIWKSDKSDNSATIFFGCTCAIWATSLETLFMQSANNKGPYQPAHPPSLIHVFVVCGLDNIIPLVSILKISSFYLASVAELARLSFTWLQTPKTGFLVMRLILTNDSLINELENRYTFNICIRWKLQINWHICTFCSESLQGGLSRTQRF